MWHAVRRAGPPVAEKSAVLSERFRTVAADLGCPLLDLADVTSFSDADGVHLDADGHRAVAEAVEAAVRGLGQ